MTGIPVYIWKGLQEAVERIEKGRAGGQELLTGVSGVEPSKEIILDFHVFKQFNFFGYRNVLYPRLLKHFMSR